MEGGFEKYDRKDCFRVTQNIIISSALMGSTFLFQWTLMTIYNRGKIEKKRQFLIDKNQCLCEHGGLNPMIARNGNYVPGNLYNNTKKHL